MASHSDSRLGQFGRLPPELRTRVYALVLSEQDGYHYNPTSGKLRASDGRIDFNLFRTCKIIAAELGNLPLRTNTVTFKTFVPDEGQPKLRDASYVPGSTSRAEFFQDLITAKIHIAQQILTSWKNNGLPVLQDNRDQDRKWHPWSQLAEYCHSTGISSEMQEKFSARQIDTSSTYPLDRLHELLRENINESNLQEVCSWIMNHYRYLIGAPGTPFYNMNASFGDILQLGWYGFQIWYYSRQDVCLALLGAESRFPLYFFSKLEHVVAFMKWEALPWDVPSTEDLLDVQRLEGRCRWLFYRQRSGNDRERDPKRFSAAAPAISFLENMSLRDRLSLRHLIVLEDEVSIVSPACHGRGLLPFLEENQHLGIERRLVLGSSVWPSIAKSATPENATNSVLSSDDIALSLPMRDAALWIYEAAICTDANPRFKVKIEGERGQREFFWACLVWRAAFLDQVSGRPEFSLEHRIMMRDKRYAGMEAPSAWPLMTVKRIAAGELAIDFGFEALEMQDMMTEALAKRSSEAYIQ